MIKESMTIQGLHVISLALTPIERWEVAGRPFNAASAAEVRLMVTLTVFAVVVLIISVILLFWTRAKYRHIAKLTVTNEKLRQEIAKLNRGQVEVLENITDAEPPREEIPALLNPQARN
jgi:cell division protein FtsB